VRCRAAVSDRGLDTIGKKSRSEVAKTKLPPPTKQLALGRITPVLERAKLSECQLVVEAATEKFEIKAEIFRNLDRLMKPDVLLASNTSSISIRKLAALTKRPDKVIGMHSSIRCR